MTAATNELTGTVELTRFIMRSNRVRILIWIAAVVALVALTAAGVQGLFPTQAALDRAAAASRSAAVVAFNGPAQGLDSLGGEVAFQAGAFGMVVVALMSLFMIGQLTRGEEEAGRLELVRSLPVGSHAPTLAALITVSAMNMAVGALTTLVLVAMSLPTAGSLVFGASFVLVGLVFSGVALLVAQVTENTRVVYGATGAVLGAAYIMRAVGDIGNGTVSWFSPIGVAQKTRPFAGERWWPFLLLIGATGVLVALASAVAARRDLGAGLVAPRPGRPAASRTLGHPIGLAVRLQRGSLIGWGVGVLIAGIAYGWIAPTVDVFIGQNKALADLLAGPGGASLTDGYFATSFRVMALLGTGFAIQSVLRLRSEETSMRAESVLATPVSRWRWAASHLAVAFTGSVILLGVAGLATGVSYGLAGGGLGNVPRVASAALVYAPPMWLMVGLTFALVGLAPRGVSAAWAIFALCFVVGFLGGILPIPIWLQNLSPYQRVPQLPAAHLTVLPLVVITSGGHPLPGEPLKGPGPAGRAVDGRCRAARHDEIILALDQKPVLPVPEQLREGATRPRDHRRASRQRLDKRQSEGLFPSNRHQEREGIAEQGRLGVIVDLADPFHQRVVEEGNHAFPVVQLVNRVDAGRDFDWDARPDGDPDGRHRVFLRVDPAQESEIAAATSPQAAFRGGLQPVVDSPHPAQAEVRQGLSLRIADRDERLVPVGLEDGRELWQVEPAMQRRHQWRLQPLTRQPREVVHVGVDDVERRGPPDDVLHLEDTVGKGVGRSHVPQWQQRPALESRGGDRCARRKEGYLVTTADQLLGQGVDDALRAAVPTRRDPHREWR